MYFGLLVMCNIIEDSMHIVNLNKAIKIRAVSSDTHIYLEDRALLLTERDYASYWS